ncbi:MAG TPA: HNH endonuclease signature motif containing protein, partial [Streptosporangiaceae bacterium]|nr:HNH endonuclease signature motif containing protein [Streptosporangiaceae bacterium]
PPAGHQRPRGRPARPPPGRLELEISWRALTGDPAGPGTLSRVGPISAGQALPLAVTAAADPHARWLVIVTDSDGYAIAVETVRRRHRTGRAHRPAGVTGLVSVTIPAATLDQLADDAHGIQAAVLRAARRAWARAQQQAIADAKAPGECAHTDATPAYRPSQKIRDYVTARDQTCRNPRCRQPARHADLDHTVPWHKGGPTCSCNLGGFCRVHHQIKQLPGWTVTQTRPGHFQLTTPAGRTYATTPDPYPA